MIGKHIFCKKPSHADNSELTDDDVIIRYKRNIGVLRTKVRRMLREELEEIDPIIRGDSGRSMNTLQYFLLGFTMSWIIPLPYMGYSTLPQVSNLWEGRWFR